ncbi:MAG: hypothetical protein GWN87_29725 [Desulfuromonadales bacterium]|nr:hypothetical protein [Desulfuromonadales bacterium]
MTASSAIDGNGLVPDISGTIWGDKSAEVPQKRYVLKPNTRLTEKADLKSFCFSPVDTVVHYIGANIDEEESPGQDNIGPLTQNPAVEEAGWTVQLGAGVERQLSKRAAFDIDYRYKSSPVDLTFDALQIPSGREHHISAGMKVFF